MSFSQTTILLGKCEQKDGPKPVHFSLISCRSCSLWSILVSFSFFDSVFYYRPIAYFRFFFFLIHSDRCNELIKQRRLLFLNRRRADKSSDWEVYFRNDDDD